MGVENRYKERRGLKAAVGIALTACCLAGFVLMPFGHMELGLMLWMVSIVGGMGYLYYLGQQKKRREAQEEQE